MWWRLAAIMNEIYASKYPYRDMVRSINTWGTSLGAQDAGKMWTSVRWL